MNVGFHFWRSTTDYKGTSQQILCNTIHQHSDRLIIIHWIPPIRLKLVTCRSGPRTVWPYCTLMASQLSAQPSHVSHELASCVDFFPNSGLNSDLPIIEAWWPRRRCRPVSPYIKLHLTLTFMLAGTQFRGLVGALQTGVEVKILHTTIALPATKRPRVGSNGGETGEKVRIYWNDLRG